MQPLERTQNDNHSSSGFTMLELIMVIAILGVMGVFGTNFLVQLFLGFRDADARMEMYQDGGAAIKRMERELHSAIPDAICVTNDNGATCLGAGSTGVAILFGASQESAMRQNDLAGTFTELAIDFPRLAPATLTESYPTATPTTNSIVSINTTSWGSFASGSQLFKITAAAGNIITFGGQTITDTSPRRRYYLTQQAVRFRWDSGSETLFRSEVGVTESGVGSFASSTEYTMAQNINDLEFSYTPPGVAERGIIKVSFNMEFANQSFSITREIHVKNSR